MLQQKQRTMNFQEAIDRACQEPTLPEALAWVAVWETERVVKQAIECERTGVSTAGNGGKWDTCFTILFKRVLQKYGIDTPSITPRDILKMLSGSR